MELMAHRGASGLAPENTLAAFVLALEFTPEWIELDVQRAADGAIVVMHDHTVDRTTNGRGRLVEMTLAEIRQLDAGAWKGPQYAGERVPTLEEVVALVAGKTRLNIEIKAREQHDYEEVVQRVVAILQEGGLLPQSMISSFDLAAVEAARAVTEEPAFALITGRAEDLTRAIEAGVGWLNLHYAAVTQELVAEAHAAGLRVCAWTINDLALWDEFAARGVDVFCTDMPHEAPPPEKR